MSVPRIFTPSDAQILRVRLAAFPGHRDVKAPTEGEEPLRCTSQIRVLKAAIEYAMTVSPKSSRNLLAFSEQYKTFLRGPIEKARREFLGISIKGFHELRAAYACRRYEQITGHPAPVILKRQLLSEKEKGEDEKARRIISHELGHNRIEITNSYLGSNSK